MNLDDLTLLRGWIRHMNLADLEAQRQEGSESARKRIKTLRRTLAAKSRFYGKPAWVKLWLTERQTTQTGESRALKALDELNGLPEPAPALDQAVERWFPESLCSALPFNVKSLSDLIDLLESFYAGDIQLPGSLKPSLKTLGLFFDDHAAQLGYP